MDLMYVADGVGASARAASEKIGDFVSVLDFGAVGDGTTDDTDAVLAAYAAGNYSLYFPPGAYVLGEVGLLGAGGLKLFGAGRLLTTILAAPSLTSGQAIFYNQGTPPATSAFVAIEDLRFRLNGQNCVAIDLDRCNNTNVNRCHFEGGVDLAGAAGVGVRFRATTTSGSYTNALTQCSFQALEKGVAFEADANSCSIFGGEFIHCTIGADAAPAGSLDTPRIFGTRFEGGGIGIKDGAMGGNYFGCRFEDHQVNDILLTANSVDTLVIGGSTSTTAVSIGGLGDAASPVIIAPDMGRYDIQQTTTPKYFGGRHAFFTRDTANPPATPNLEYAAYFHGAPMLRNHIGLDGVNAAGTNSILIAQVNPSDEVEIPAYSRADLTYGVVNIGGGASVRPLTAGETDLGDDARPWRDVRIAGTYHVDGVQVVGPQGAAVADAVDAATAITQLNALLARLRAHGLIG